MGRRRKNGRAVHGVLVLHKPQGMTSNNALQRARYLFNANRAGHTGALDPLATGVLPLCFGEATKFSQYLLDADKGYRSTFKLGVSTNTLDAEGEVVASHNAAHLSEADIRAAIEKFIGDIEQIPPMVSALKFHGQPLYKLAREGKEVERKPRPITIYAIEVLAIRLGEVAEVDVEVSCSKGTYIRSLAQDIGDTLGVGGHVAKLHRIKAGAFLEADCVTLESLETLCKDHGAEALDPLLAPIDATVDGLPVVTIESAAVRYFCNGNAVPVSQVYQVAQQGDKVRVFGEAGQFLGVAVVAENSCLAPSRLVVL